MKPGDTELVNEKHSYFFHPKHRGAPSADASIWTIPIPTELNVFVDSLEALWIDEVEGWGLCIGHEGNVLPLGKNLVEINLFIAKFVRKRNNAPWHGYPADYIVNPQDRPTPAILLEWHEQGIIQKYEIARIRGGRPCSLC
jgi:hypothetical protein